MNGLILNYDGWCRRIDLYFRSRFPYLDTRLFKIDEYKYQLFLIGDVDNFDEINDIFDREIRILTVPIKLVMDLPKAYRIEIEKITDDKIPSKFEGCPLTIPQLYSHILSIHPNVKVDNIEEDHDNRLIVVGLSGNYDSEIIEGVEKTVTFLKAPYSFKIKNGGGADCNFKFSDEVFNIAPSQTKKELNCAFIERDEALWFENVESIYNGSYQKSDLYFF